MRGGGRRGSLLRVGLLLADLEVDGGAVEAQAAHVGDVLALGVVEVAGLAVDVVELALELMRGHERASGRRRGGRRRRELALGSGRLPAALLRGRLGRRLLLAGALAVAYRVRRCRLLGGGLLRRLGGLLLLGLARALAVAVRGGGLLRRSRLRLRLRRLLLRLRLRLALAVRLLRRLIRLRLRLLRLRGLERLLRCGDRVLL